MAYLFLTSHSRRETLTKEGWKMSKRLLTLALTGLIFSTQVAQATVPGQALTFDTNVSITNATTTMTDKIRKAEELIKRVVATDDFRDQVINHTWNGKREYVDNGGYSNEEIYQIILDAAERLNGIKNNTMDIDIEMYYENTSTVGYTYSNTPKIYANTKFYNDYSSATITGNMTHEWLHKLGFSHATYYSESRDHSVPYAIGYIMRSIAATLPADVTPVEYITAPSNVQVSNSTSNVTLTWTAGTSSDGVASYKVYRRLSGSTTNYLQATVTSLSYTQARPSSGATYYVKTVDKDGDTAKSAEVNYVPLTAPTGLTASKTSTSVTLKWNAAQSSAGVKEYKVYRRLYGSSTTYLQGTVTGLTFTQPRSSSSAYYYVRSVDVNGETKKSAEVYVSKY